MFNFIMSFIAKFITKLIPYKKQIIIGLAVIIVVGIIFYAGSWFNSVLDENKDLKHQNQSLEHDLMKEKDNHQIIVESLEKRIKDKEESIYELLQTKQELSELLKDDKCANSPIPSHYLNRLRKYSNSN